MSNIRPMFLPIIMALSLVLCTITGTVAQTPNTGTLRGRLYEAGSNLPIPRARINVIHQDSGIKRGSVTDSAGDFLIRFLPSGQYRIDYEKQGYESESVYELVTVNKSTLIPPIYLRAKDLSLPKDYTTPPNLQISSPEINQGQELKLATNTITVKGQAISSTRISFIILQGNIIQVDEQGEFSGEVPLKDGANHITVTAIDIYRNWTRVEFTVIKGTSDRALQTKAQSLSTTLKSRKYFALVIGNDKYQYIQPLQTGVHDAEVVASILRDKYGFNTQLLLNANRERIVVALNEYRRNLDESANLLIYYAGHGFYDREVEKAYWLPVDAREEDNVYWISSDDVTTYIRPILARHILIVSDSCYSGALARGVEAKSETTREREQYLQKILEGKSRRLVSSGGNEPVADGESGNHSVFASALIKGLIQMEKNTFTAGELFYEFIEEPVAGKSQQTPQYSPLRNSGHESGDFVFVRKM